MKNIKRFIDWKKKQKPEEPDVDIPLVEPEPLGEMKL